MALKEHRRVRTFVGVSGLSKEDTRLQSSGVFHHSLRSLSVSEGKGRPCVFGGFWASLGMDYG